MRVSPSISSCRSCAACAPRCGRWQARGLLPPVEVSRSCAESTWAKQGESGRGKGRQCSVTLKDRPGQTRKREVCPDQLAGVIGVGHLVALDHCGVLRAQVSSARSGSYQEVRLASGGLGADRPLCGPARTPVRPSGAERLLLAAQHGALALQRVLAGYNDQSPEATTSHEPNCVAMEKDNQWYTNSLSGLMGRMVPGWDQTWASFCCCA